jgi:NADH-quinone oxidoreductase subunit F
MDPILTRYVHEPNSFTLDFYLQHEGYEALKTALTKKPDELIELVKASGLRGRGGAGFPTGMKWQFVDKKIEPRYIACNADESEPGTFKDHLLMERNPHLLVEGCAIGCYAIGAKVAYIYIRGEFLHVQAVLERAIDDAYARGFLGKNIPALVGLYGKPTAVNNVETLCNVPPIVRHGAEWYAKLGPEKNGGPKLYCVSGHVRRPGVFEASMNITLRELIEDRAGGVREGRTLKAVIPGGSSVPLLLPDQLDTQASFDAIQKAGSLLGSAAIVVLDDTTCIRHEYEAHIREGRCTLPADWRARQPVGAH